MYDEAFLSRAFKLALLGRFTTAPNPNVGCVVVRDGCIVGEGYHLCAGEDHAEVNALRMAGNFAQGSTVYVTLEPCNHYGRTPPCSTALVNAGVERIVISMLDPNPRRSGQGLCYLHQAGIDVSSHSLMLSTAETINKGFCKRVRTGLPWIQLKLATSLDGRIALSSGESKWITSVQARQDVQRLRAESDAILSTSKTVITDDPMFNVRWSCLPKEIKQICDKNKLRQPIRVIIDSSNRVSPMHKVVQNEGVTLLARIKKDSYVWPSSVEQVLLPEIINENGIKRLDLLALIKLLGDREINNVFVEAGASLSGALLSSGLVDELVIYQATKLLGAEAKPLCILPKVAHLSDVISFKLIDVKQVGPDIRLQLYPNVV